MTTTLTLSEFEKLHRNNIITHVNDQGLCIEEDYQEDTYYIKIQTDKYPEVNWRNECDISICKFKLNDAKVVDIHYSGKGKEFSSFDLFD